MLIQKPLNPCDQYSIDDLGRICPTHTMGWAKSPWKNEPSFDDAIAKIAASPVFEADAWIGIEANDWLDLKSKKYLCIEDGFYLATGFNGQSAVFRFEFRDEIFFNMRPDFPFLTLANDFNEQPINDLESVVRDWMLDFYRETEAISRAIAVKEIDPLKLYPIETWLDFWQTRGIIIQKPSLTEPNESKPITETERDKLLRVIGLLVETLANTKKANLRKPDGSICIGDGKLGKTGETNMVKELLDTLQSLSESSTNGLGKTVLQDTIKAGIKALHDSL